MVFGSSGRMRMPRCIVPSFTHRYPYDFRLQGRDDRRRRRGLSGNATALTYENYDSNSSGISYGNGDENLDEYDVDNDRVDESGSNSSHRRRRASTEPDNNNNNKVPMEKTKDPFHRRANGVSLAKSFVRLDALPNQAWNPTVNTYSCAQRMRCRELLLC
jgi:hypothetical protein